MSELPLNDYTWQMNLTIRDLTDQDFVDYTCASVNALGTSEEKVRLQSTIKIIPYFIHYYILLSLYLFQLQTIIIYL